MAHFGLSGHTWSMPATVQRIIDGDTFVAMITFMPGKTLAGEHVRVQGINAPERSHTGGSAATAFATQLLSPPGNVTLQMTEQDKYGRVLAKVLLSDGRDFGAAMIEAGHAVAYEV